MAEEPKKISFGFSKLSKKPSVVIPLKKEETEIQFIDSLEGNTINLVNGPEKEKEALVIPVRNANLLRDNMIETLKARKSEGKSMFKVTKNASGNSENGPKEDTEDRPLTLDELAAKEILEDLKKDNDKEETPLIHEIPASNSTSLVEKESTLEDYENVPVQEFGLAVLRGMGWTPDKGIGKNGQIVQPVNPVLRPKGMGLGADKVIKIPTSTNNKDDLVMKKNAALKIFNGPYKGLYGKIEGFDELPGRLMVRLTLQNNLISISENLVQLVTLQEYNANSKILNLNDFNSYHDERDTNNMGKKAIKDSRAEKHHSYPENKIIIREKSNERERRSVSNSSESDARYSKQTGKKRKLKSRDRSSSPSPDRRRIKPKTYKKQSPLSSSDEHSRKSRRRKHVKIKKGRSGSPYTKIKSRRKYSDSEEEYKKRKSRYSSSSSSNEENYKASRSSSTKFKSSSLYKNETDSSGSEDDRKKKVKYPKSSKKYDTDSDSPPLKHSKHKKHDRGHKAHSRASSPTKKKKRKKHRRSNS